MDTLQQAAALRSSATARKVRARFSPGTRIRGIVGDQLGTVVRHIPMRDAQGGVLVVDWDNGHSGRVQPCTVEVAS